VVFLRFDQQLSLKNSHEYGYTKNTGKSGNSMKFGHVQHQFSVLKATGPLYYSL